MTDIDLDVYKATFDETNNPALVTDTNFIIQDINQAFVDFSGYEKEDIIGETPDVVFHEESIYTEMATQLAKGERWEGGFEATTKAGRAVYGRGSAFPIEDDDGNLKSYAGVFTDLTERKRYEDTLKIVNRVLRHNLKNDANVILGYITTVREQLNNDELDGFLGKAEAKVDSLLNHSDTARNLQTLLSGTDQETIQPVRIDTVIESEIRSAKTQYEDATITFVNPPESYVFALADESIYEILIALFENAIHHNDTENPRLDVSLETDPDFVTIRVKDNGPGIAEGRKDIIFGREERDQLHHGQGFSLFFVDNVIQKYKGDIWVENNSDQDGASFYVKLPRPDETPSIDSSAT